VTATEPQPNQNAEQPDEKGRARQILEWLILGALFVVLHVWAMSMLWLHGPANRQGILVTVYAGTLLGSCVLTKRFPPPLTPSLMLFGVVAAWRFWWI
jgi:hypothetical protein